MKSRYNAIIGVLVTVLFFAAFFTGKAAEHNHGFGHIHEAMGTLALLCVILHLFGICKVFICHLKTLIKI
ncbi:MAG: hypothetical protein ABRQ39_17765 [Candidatus Eremiobacterota bacterium]